MLSFFNRFIGKNEETLLTKKISSVELEITVHTIDMEDIVLFTASINSIDTNSPSSPIRTNLTGEAKLELAFLEKITAWVKSQLDSTQKEPLPLSLALHSPRDRLDRLTSVSIKQVCENIHSIASEWLTDQITYLPLFHVKKCIGYMADEWDKSSNPTIEIHEIQQTLKAFLTTDLYNQFLQRAEKIGIAYIENEAERTQFPGKVCILNQFDENNMPLCLSFYFGGAHAQISVKNYAKRREDLIKKLKEKNFEIADLFTLHAELKREMKIFVTHAGRTTQDNMHEMITAFNAKWLGKATISYTFNNEERQYAVQIQDVFNTINLRHKIQNWNTGNILSGKFLRDLQEKNSPDNVIPTIGQEEKEHNRIKNSRVSR